MAVAQTPVCTLNNASGTTKESFQVGGSGYAPSTKGDRLKSITINTGPTTAPGGTYTVMLILYDGTAYTYIAPFTLVNTVNTNIVLEQLFTNIVIPSGGGLYAQMITTLSSGASVELVASVTANPS